MVRLFKYISVLMVVLLAFTFNVRAAGDQDSSKMKKTALDSIVIQVNGISTDDTLVFDDFDEDEPVKEDTKSTRVSKSDSASDMSSSCTSTFTTEMISKLPEKKSPSATGNGTGIMFLGQRVDGSQFFIDGTPVIRAQVLDTIRSDNRQLQRIGQTNQDLFANVEMTLYPNPVSSATQQITIEHNGQGTTSIYVRTIGGQLIHQVITSQKSILIDHLASGTYIVQIVDEQNHIAAQRLIVQ